MNTIKSSQHEKQLSQHPPVCIPIPYPIWPILNMPRPFRQRHVHSGDATSIPATPRPFRRRHVHPGDPTSIPATSRPSRRRHVHSGDATSILVTVSLLSLVGLSRRRQASPVVGTALPSPARPSRRRHGPPVDATAPDDSGQSLTILDSPQCFQDGH